MGKEQEQTGIEINYEIDTPAKAEAEVAQALETLLRVLNKKFTPNKQRLMVTNAVAALQDKQLKELSVDSLHVQASRTLNIGLIERALQTQSSSKLKQERLKILKVYTGDGKIGVPLTQVVLDIFANARKLTDAEKAIQAMADQERKETGLEKEASHSIERIKSLDADLAKTQLADKNFGVRVAARAVEVFIRNLEDYADIMTVSHETVRSQRVAKVLTDQMHSKKVLPPKEVIGDALIELVTKFLKKPQWGFAKNYNEKIQKYFDGLEPDTILKLLKKTEPYKAYLAQTETVTELETYQRGLRAYSARFMSIAELQELRSEKIPVPVVADSSDEK